jgi:NADPH-dependent FMN reductase
MNTTASSNGTGKRRESATLQLKLIAGSTRPGRSADRVLPWLSERARSDGRFAVDVLDLRDWDLPMFAESQASIGDPRDPTYSSPDVRRWNHIVSTGDAYLFLTPEYNHSIPGALKKPSTPFLPATRCATNSPVSSPPAPGASAAPARNTWP